MMLSIWLVEDEAYIADSLIYMLEKNHYQVRWFERGELMLKALSTSQPNLMILDVGLPDIIGFELAKQVLLKYDIPIIFLTARDDEIDRIIGLEIGADDYIVKPFSLREVLARIKTVLRRFHKQSPPIANIALGPFMLNEEGSVIYYYNERLSLTRYEYSLLKTMIKAPNRIFSRKQLLDIVWQDNLSSMERTVDTHIKTIRQKLTMVYSADEQPIQTHHGLGYSLKID
ncbi:two-component system response regulator CreB [Frischella sp. Ac48]|uniref:Two-component system response regulator CreB n=1 Tax=Frischella japonica TaxID=2741544 RepID=A0ABR7QVP3_9GAMM|nr:MULTISPECIES: two-component system response regulator CreB [Frischella]MBC9130292.1 two-component system response regulator CreB [Frischella japonica]MBX4133281.1 two-component system response regulator CreB [Frischella sp. Ac48]